MVRVDILVSWSPESASLDGCRSAAMACQAATLSAGRLKGQSKGQLTVTSHNISESLSPLVGVGWAVSIRS